MIFKSWNFLKLGTPMSDGPGSMCQCNPILNEHKPMLGNKDQWNLAGLSEAPAYIQSTLPSPWAYESII